MEGFVQDEPGTFDIVNPEADPTNSGMKRRRTLFAASRSTMLMGSLHCDIFAQKKYLLNYVPMRVTLHRNPDGFCLIKHGNTNYKISISDMTLKIPLVKVSEAMRQSVESLLLKTPALYPIKRTVMQSHLIPAGTTSFSLPGLFRGNLPSLVIFGMVKNEDRRNDPAKNCFNFEEFNISKLACFKNSEPIGHNNGLQMDFTLTSFLYTEAYKNFISAIGPHKRGVKITAFGFRAGFAFFPFQVAPPPSASLGAGSDENSVNTAVLNQGVVDVEMSFRAQTPANIDLIVYAQYNSQITINNARDVQVTNV